MDLKQLQQTYIDVQNGSSELRRHVGKMIRFYNTNAKKEGIELFDPFFYIKENLPSYYKYLLATCTNNLDVSKFDYNSRFINAIFKFDEGNPRYYELSFSSFLHQNNNINLTLFGSKFIFGTCSQRYHSGVLSILDQQGTVIDSNNRKTTTSVYNLDESLFYLKEM